MVEWVVASLALENLGALARRSFSSYSVGEMSSHHGHRHSQHVALAWRQGLN